MVLHPLSAITEVGRAQELWQLLLAGQGWCGGSMSVRAGQSFIGLHSLFSVEDGACVR